jgi:aldehyde:ferredoxin oxidoreductase
MKGWTGKYLRINLSSKQIKKEEYDLEFAHKWVGGRGFAIKILWDELKPGIDPLGPENKLIIALGTLSGLTAPTSAKAVVAAKSPLTGGYGDGNIGSKAAMQLRKAGYDYLIIEGKAEKPTLLNIEDDKIELLSADEVWGKGVYETLEILYKRYSKRVGILTIGQAGENKVLYAVIRAMEGRAGGRPGMGAVMGSKNLKAIIVKGTKDIPLADSDGLKKIGSEDLKGIQELDKKVGWSKQGSPEILAWCNEVAALPVRNMRKTSSKDAWKIDGERLQAARVATYGCPNCSMHCGHAILDKEGHISELDYENVGMLGSNLEIFDRAQVASLNYLCDDYGIDTISAGAVLAFYADAIDHGLTQGDFKFGQAEKAKELLRKIACREQEGDLLAQGTKKMAEKIGQGSMDFAMQVKGLEISAYNCKFIPGMALSFGTSSIGGHHKEAWIITFEIKESSRDSYGRDKAQKIIDLQRIRGGLFEVLGVCRYPWIEIGWGIEHYPLYFNKATGLNWRLKDFDRLADRIYALIRAFWVREIPDWNREYDSVPKIWFDPKNADTEGPIAGKILEFDKYNQLLDHYYDIRCWDKKGIPTKQTMKELDLEKEAVELEDYVSLE